MSEKTESAPRKEMTMDTKALDEILKVAKCTQFPFEMIEQAAAELAELKAENEKSDVVLVFMQHELDTDRLTFRDAVEAIDKYRAELDEARKFIEEEVFVTLKARMWLQVHPKRR